MKIRFLSAILIAGFWIFLISILVVGFKYSVPSFDQVKNNFRPSDVWVVDRNGIPMESIRTSGTERSLEWTKWNEVSPAFKKLLIETEDKRFYSHSGVDFLALGKAALTRIQGESYRGASTLSMQLEKLIQNQEQKNRRSVFGKFKQIFWALKLESYWSKEQILEAYVNLVPFRGELVGLKAASLGYFTKPPEGLTLKESALLVALIRSPNATPTLVAKRACIILHEKKCETITKLSEGTFSHPYNLPRNRETVPVLSKKFVSKNTKTNSAVIQTDLDIRIQRLALKALQEQLRFLQKQNVQDAAALVLETKTGRVVAYVANAGPRYSSAPQTDGILMKRQAGSTIKPFVYATAFERNLIKSDSLLNDSPADIPISKGRVYHPRNYDNSFRGFVGVGEALGSSLNVPAVKTLQLVGETRTLEKMRELGFTELEDDEYYGPSLALGAVDVSLWELTNAYRQLQTNRKVFSKGTRRNIFNILASTEYRRFTFGMSSLLNLPFAAAVKTGTSKDMRDNWCIGWTQDYTVGVWVGNFDGKPMWNVSGTSGAAPVWQYLMRELHPQPILQSKTQYVPPAKPLQKRVLSHIRYPVSDMMLGFDPDIPKSVQKLPIEIENPQKAHKIFLNKKLIGKADESILWPLQKGKFRIELRDPKGEVVDQVRFEVR